MSTRAWLSICLNLYVIHTYTLGRQSRIPKSKDRAEIARTGNLGFFADVYGSFAERLGPLRLYRALLCMCRALHIYLSRPLYIYLRLPVLTHTLSRQSRNTTRQDRA